MNFLEAVNALTRQYRVRRPWKNNENKHLVMKHHVAGGQIIRFQHNHPNTEYPDFRELDGPWTPYIIDILATDWEIYTPDGYPG